MSKPELNGVRGELLKQDDKDEGRFYVKLGDGKVVSLKLRNFRAAGVAPTQGGAPAPTGPAPRDPPHPAAPGPAAQAPAPAPALDESYVEDLDDDPPPPLAESEPSAKRPRA